MRAGLAEWCVGREWGSPLATVWGGLLSPRAICCARCARSTDATGGYLDATLRVGVALNEAHPQATQGLRPVRPGVNAGQGLLALARPSA